MSIQEELNTVEEAIVKQLQNCKTPADRTRLAQLRSEQQRLSVARQRERAAAYNHVRAWDGNGEVPVRRIR